MSPEIAIELLKEQRDLLISGIPVFGSETVDEYDAAIEALKRYIPETPLLDGHFRGGERMWRCRNCFQDIGTLDERGISSICGKFCPTCGHPINWIDGYREAGVESKL